jgi:hypothetical protein
MPVTTTPQSLINAAYAKSLKNKANTIASESGELLQLVIRTIRSLYAAGARINPYFFSESANVAFSAPGWARPEGAQLIYRIEAASSSPPTSITAGTEIAVVPFEAKATEPGKPALFRFGQIYRPVSASATVAPISPQNGTLTFYYSRRPTDPASLAATVDPLWIEDFNEIPILRIARYLALKDGRGDEVAGIDVELKEWAQQYVAFLEHETANEIRSYGHIGRFNAPSLVPVMSLITGIKQGE